MYKSMGAENLETRADAFLLEAGHIYFTRNPEIIHTVLGTSVSVCLWDKRLSQGGMNHFRRPAGQSRTSSPDFGDGAMIGLLRIMKQSGSRSGDIVAQIFGGGSPENQPTATGMANVNAARTILNRLRIKIVSEDTGGIMGRKLAFDTSNGQAAVLKVFKLRETDWHG